MGGAWKIKVKFFWCFKIIYHIKTKTSWSNDPICEKLIATKHS